MHDQRHAGDDLGFDVFENMRLGVGKEAEPVAAHARIFAGHVIAEAMASKHVVFGPRNIGGLDAGPHRRDAGFERVAVERETCLLVFVRLTDHQRAADLRVIAVDAGRQLGGDEIALLQFFAHRRRHAAHFRAADADDHEIIVDALPAIESLDLGDELVIGAAGTRRRPKHRIAFVGHPRGLAHGRDFGLALHHQQCVDESGFVADAPARIRMRKPAR